MEITPSTLQPNLIPITVEDLNIQEGMAIDGTPAANTPATPATDLNIQVSANGSVMSIGNLQSTNFHAGSAGWRLDSNGNIEANDGNFRGDITGSSGTFTGTITATGGAIGGWSIDTTSIFTGTEDHSGYTANAGDLTIYSNGTVASIHGKEFYIGTDGKLTCTSITATGTINAQAGYLSSGVYIDAADGIVCESGGFDVGVSGHIRGGSTDYNTGAGWWIGYDTTAYKLSIGNPADTDKLLLWDGTDLIVNNSKISLNFIFGDGSDGDVTISSDTTLTSDKFYNDLTIDVTYTLNTGGYRVYIKGTLTNNGTIHNAGGVGTDATDGGDASVGTGGSGGTKGTGGVAAGIGYYITTAAGKDGGNGGGGGGCPAGAGSAGTAADVNTTKSYLSDDGKAGGTGGTGGSGSCPVGGSGGAGGAAGTTTQATYISKTSVENQLGICFDDLTTLAKFSASGGSGGSGGGGGGASDSSNAKGGGGGGGAGSGAPGGIVYLVARTMINTGTISAKGGDGGIGGTGGDAWTLTSNESGGGAGGAGGSGGTGGILTIIYSILTNSGTITIAGGTGGAGGAGGAKAGGGGSGAGGGSIGTTGANGLLIQLEA